MEKVSIVILTHNALRYCRILFRSLAITSDVNYEVVVVDNASSLLTRLYLFWLFVRHKINRLCLLGYNSLFAEGNNIGVRSSSEASKYVVLLNSDVEIRHRLWLRKLIDTHKPGASAYGYCSDVWPHTDGYCFLIERELYLKYRLDEHFPWWWALTKLQTELLKDGLSVQSIRQHGDLLHHFGGKSGTAYLDRDLNIPPKESVIEWFGGRHIEVIESV